MKTKISGLRFNKKRRLFEEAAGENRSGRKKLAGRRRRFFLSAFQAAILLSAAAGGAIGGEARAQGGEACRVSASIDRAELPLNGRFQFQVQIRFSGEEPEEILEPDFAALNNFHFLGRHSGFQTQIRIHGGRMETEKTKTFTYTLSPRAEGDFQIKGLKVQIDGRDCALNPVSLKVTAPLSSPPPGFAPGPPPPSGPPPGGPDPFPPLPGFPDLSPGRLFDRFFGPSFPDSPFQERAGGEKSLLFRLNLKKASYYLGELIRADWFVLSSSPRIRFRPFKKPSLKNFLKEELSDRPRFIGTETENGVLYRKTLLDSQALFALKPGPLTIGAYQLKFSVMPFFAAGQERTKSAPARVIEALPLPPLPRGAGGFSGAVGDFSASASLDRKETSANQPLTLRLKIFGRGHPRLIQQPEILFPDSFQIYPAAEAAHFSFQESWKEFEILLIPKKAGDFFIPAARFTYFNPTEKAYKNLTVPAFSLKILPGQEEEREEEKKFFAGGDPSDKEKGGGEGAVLKLSMQSGDWPFSRQRIILFFRIFFALAVGWIGALAARAFFKQKTRRPSFKAEARRRLEIAKRAAAGGEQEKAGLQLIQLIHQAIAEAGGGEVSEGEGAEALPPELKRRFGKAVSKLLSDLNAAVYSQERSARDPRKIQTLIKQTEHFLKQIQDESPVFKPPS